MFRRPYLCLALAVMISGCAAEREKQKKKEEETKKKERAEKLVEDPAFTAFLGRLRTAAAKKDKETLTSMMTRDFGYRWDEPPVGDNVFTYWDLNESWPILNKILREQFVPHGNYMVAPSAVANDATYSGFRAGIRLVSGSWKFAYFVPGEGVLDR
jgi:hypothetical protein